MSPPTELLTEGISFADGYTVTGTIDIGGYAVVYDAVRDEDQRSVALKVLRHSATDLDPSAAQRFIREAAVAARLRHPNIVEVLDFGHTEGGVLYMVMERLFGQRLLDVMFREPLPASTVREVLLQVLGALVLAHGEGLVHRDLKPANVFLCDPPPDSGDARRVKLLDFGFTKGFWGDERLTRQHLTNEGEQVGTAGYVAPEVLKGEKTITPQVDLYTVGILGWEMLAAEPAFKGNSMQRLFAQLTRDPTPPNEEMTREPVFQVIQRLMEREPADRYASAGDAITGLEAIDA